MDIGLGLPNTAPGLDGPTLVDWAREGERAGFASLATTDRIVYDSYESLVTLGAAAAVTTRCRLTSAILIAPARVSTVLLAKQIATVDRISAGRLVLGLAVGARPDDFTASGAEHAGRGDRFDVQLAELGRIWAGERRGFAGGVGPVPARHGGPEILLGGHSPRAIERTARHAQGWISGSGGLGMFRGGAAQLRDAWQRARRPGQPRLLALAYVSVGRDAHEQADRYVGDYYGFAPPYAAQVRKGVSIGEQQVAETISQFAAAGCDELILVPCSAAIEQIGLLETVAGEAGAVTAVGASG